MPKRFGIVVMTGILASAGTSNVSVGDKSSFVPDGKSRTGARISGERTLKIIQSRAA